MPTQRHNEMPIDRGWAWVIVAAACGIFALAAGGFKTQGVILLEVIERFEGRYSPSTLLWVFTVSFFIDSLSGPVAGLVMVKLGHRVSAIIGVLAISISHIGIGYAFNLATLFIFFSIPAGLGYGFLIMTSLLVSGPYFRKRRGLAIGLVAAGSGVGTFLLPYILRGLFTLFDFTGAMLLYGGFNLQFLCLAMLLRPISYYEDMCGDKTVGDLGDETEMTTQTTDANQNDELLDPKPRNRSASHCHQTLTVAAFCEVRRRDNLSKSANFLDLDDKKSITTANDNTNQFHLKNEEQIEENRKMDDNSTLLAKNINTDRQSRTAHIVSVGDLAGSVMFIDRDDDNKNNNTSQDKPESASLQQGEAKQRFDWRILLMPKLLMFCLSIVVFSMANAVIYATLPSLGKERGVSKETVALSTMLAGLVEIPCRIGNGFLSDRKYISATSQYTLCLLVAGLLTLVATLLPGVSGVILGLFGFATMGTSVFNLTPVVLRELLGAEHVTSSMGVQSAVQGIAFLASSYVTGAIYERSGSWTDVYYYISAMVILGSIVVWPYIIIARCRNSSATKTLNEA